MQAVLGPHFKNPWPRSGVFHNAELLGNPLGINSGSFLMATEELLMVALSNLETAPLK